MMNQLVQLLYISHLAKGIGPVELGNILVTSRKNNEKADVTGALCYSQNGFLQCLEGPADAVNELYRRIMRDDRHVDVMLLDYRDVDERSFGQWRMAYVREDEVDRDFLIKTRGSERFDPFDMTAGEALELLLAIVKERETFLRKQQEEISKDMESL